MQIYFAASIAGGRGYLNTYQKMAEFIKQQGHAILTEHIVSPNVWHLESKLSPEQIYTRDIQWLSQADLLIAEVSNPSLGVGYEIGYALSLSKPVLCLFHQDVLLSRMILGNTRPGLQVLSYNRPEDWQKSINRFLER
jgi:2'-deoxynucleoside 5'-phosphate N-hydrolase